jgi:hypothetical protein
MDSDRDEAMDEAMDGTSTRQRTTDNGQDGDETMDKPLLMKFRRKLVKVVEKEPKRPHIVVVWHMCTCFFFKFRVFCC